MNKHEALDLLDKACELVFQVESRMDIKKSKTRLIGYQARIKIGELKNKIKQSSDFYALKDL